MSQRHRRRPPPLRAAPPTLQSDLRELIELEGIVEAERALDISKDTIARLLAGMPVRETTITHVRQRIREWREDRTAREPCLTVIEGGRGDKP